MIEVPVALSTTNWAGNYTYWARTLHRPQSLEQLQEVVSAGARVKVLGSRHSFTGIVDSAELVSLEAMTSPDSVVVAPDRRTVTVDAGLTYGEVAAALQPHGLALHNLASLPHISVAGAVATATHGSGVGNGNLATAVAALELVTSAGEVVRAARGDADFDGMVVGLGALGAVTRVTLDVEPAFEVRQQVFDHLPWTALFEHFDEVVSCGYSVSLFTLFGGDVDMVWVKSRTDAAAPPEGELFGAVAADGERHPIPGIDPSPTTPQLGSAGPWSDRLPHFRMGFTPSNGDEIQSEYLLPRAHAVPALEALRALADRIRPLLQTCEIRTVAADRLWLSTAHEQDSVALHFTWVQAQSAVEELLVDLEAALLPLGARPHWGKVFLADAGTLAPRYPRHADFADLVQRLDPRRAFGNAWLERHVLGG
ncbi:putative xylitol oxidase [Modestobacter italicus]|uniref:Xylitol oxidase n=1 Tax=Modestobacter italicus (strain DSM 44449 / CECT 9708 / BC 501) TaxID=2732864 RepID=I4EWE1_MODI5|nr:D-arabinono-1,4-lactone oxidase [Modestobacter marinus]CCH87704.1 putative xylitol oxidase [Modestobacter marinus]